jgi:hypothetical protein
MSEFDTLQSVDHQQNPSVKKTQFTLEANDLDEMTASLMFGEDEQKFIDQLDVDAESKVKQVTNSTVTNVAEEHKVIDLDEMKRYVLKCVGRQDFAQNFAAIEFDFFDKVELVVDEMTENSFFRIETFVNTRLDRIISYSKVFSENVSSKLTREEKSLYIDLCDRVAEFRKVMNQRLKGNLS